MKNIYIKKVSKRLERSEVSEIEDCLRN